MTGWAVPGFVHVRELGQDSVGRRVVARYPLTRKLVSITYLSRELLADTGFRERFAVDSRQLMRVRDARVERVRGYVECGDGAAIVTDYVPGTLLRVLLRDEGAVGPEASLVLFKDVLLGLAAGHDAGLVHGDVKPEGVLLTSAGRVRLVDFGLSTRTGRLALARSTPFYLAPEQWQGGRPTAAGDVYAATAIFFECLAGGPPFYAGGTAELAVLHQQGTPPLDVVPEPVRQLVHSGLAKDPTCRPAARQFLVQVDQAAIHSHGTGWERRGRGELTRLLTGPSQPASAAVPAGSSGRLGGERRRPVRFAAVLGGSLVLAVGMSSPPLASVWLPKIPGSVSGSEARPPEPGFGSPPEDVVGSSDGAEAPIADDVPAHQPTALVARARQAAAGSASSGSVPSGERSHPEAVLCDQPGLSAELADPQLTQTPGRTSATTEQAATESTDPATETPAEPSTSAQPMSDPPPAASDGTGRSAPESPDGQEQGSADGEPADQDEPPADEPPDEGPPDGGPQEQEEPAADDPARQAERADHAVAEPDKPAGQDHADPKPAGN